MNLPLRLALREMRAKPAAAAVTIVGLAVGVAGVRAMSLGADGALETLRNTFAAAAGPADLVAIPAGDARGALPDGTSARLAAVPGVRDLLPLVQAPSLRVEEAKLWMGVVLPEGDSGVLVLGVDPAKEHGRWSLVEGRDTFANGEVLVAEPWARARGLHPGDPLHLFASGRVLDWRVGGTVERAGLGGRGYGRVVVAPIEAVRAGFGLGTDEVHELAIVGDVKADVLAAAAGPGVTVLDPADRGGEVAQKLANMRAGTDLLSGVTLLLAALLVAGQFAARAAERERTLGLLRAVGATRHQAAVPILVEGAILGFVGSALGVALGSPLAMGVAWALGQAAQADLVVGTFDLVGGLRAWALGVIAALCAVAGPALRAARDAPLANVRARGAAAKAPAWTQAIGSVVVLTVVVVSLRFDPAGAAPREWTLARVLVGLTAAAMLLPPLLPFVVGGVLGPLSRRLGPSALLGAASLRWRPVRSGLAAGAVLACVALVGGVGALGGGMRAEMESWSRRALGWDYYVSRPDGFTDTEVDEIRALPGVVSATGVSIRPVLAHFGEKRAALSFVALDPARYAGEDLLTFAPDTVGKPAEIVASLADGEGVLVTTVVSAQFGLREGSRVELPGRNGPLLVTVRGRVVDYTQNGFAILGADSLLRRLQGETRVDLVAVRGDAALDTIPGAVVERRDALRGRVLRLVDQSMAALDVLSWLGGVVGVLAVGAALAQGAVERRADVAILRALGMERRQVTGMLVAEGILTAGVGILLGVPLGVGLGKVFADATHTLGIPVPYVPAWSALAGASTAALTAAALAAWLPARRAAEVSPAEATRE